MTRDLETQPKMDDFTMVAIMSRLPEIKNHRLEHMSIVADQGYEYENSSSKKWSHEWDGDDDQRPVVKHPRISASGEKDSGWFVEYYRKRLVLAMGK
jgi:hypothetical protein